MMAISMESRRQAEFSASPTSPASNSARRSHRTGLSRHRSGCRHNRTSSHKPRNPSVHAGLRAICAPTTCGTRANVRGRGLGRTVNRLICDSRPWWRTRSRKQLFSDHLPRRRGQLRIDERQQPHGARERADGPLARTVSAHQVHHPAFVRDRPGERIRDVVIHNSHPLHNPTSTSHPHRCFGSASGVEHATG